MPTLPETDIDSMYRAVILDLYRHPLNKKTLSDFDCAHTEYNASCGDEITLQIKWNQEGKIIDVGHHGHGCAISQAAVSLLTEAIKGKTIAHVQTLQAQDVYQLLGFDVIYTRRKCATLGLRAAQTALEQSDE